MGLRRRVCHQVAGAAEVVGVEVGGALASRYEGAQGGARRRVLDDSPARPAAVKGARQVEEIDHPVEDAGLELGAGRAGGPHHPLYRQPRRSELAEDRRPRIVARKEGEEVGRLPVRDAGQDDLVEVADDVLERLAGLRSALRQGRRYLAGLHLGQDRQRLHPLLVVGDPIDQLMATAAELLGGHVIAALFGHRSASR